MHVVPVLDIKNAQVVLATGGQRDSYRPIDTPLCRDAAPIKVVESLLEIAEFDTFYVADLDAIQGAASNFTTIERLARLHPRIAFWLDAGFATADQARVFASLVNIRLVVGSETLNSVDDYLELCRDPIFDGHILSLDRKAGNELGPEELIHRTELWPDTIISMDLAQVGRARGPNIDRIKALRDRRDGIDVVAAGGIRHLDDLTALASDGVNYALVATALHNQTLRGEDIRKLKKTPLERGVFHAV